MRKLIYLILGVSILWGGYWFIGASAVEIGIRDWLNQDRRRGLQTEYEGIATRGFPNRFDTTVTGLEIFDPVSGNSWSAPFFQVFALTYKPNHIIAVWPGQQTIRIARDDIQVASQRLRASVVFEPGTSLAFERGTVEMEEIELKSAKGWKAGLQSAQFSVRQSVGLANSYDLSLDADRLRIPRQVRDAFGANSKLPRYMQKFDVTATLEFDHPWDRFAAEGQSPIIQAVKVKNFETHWGTLGLLASGEFTVNKRGIPTGRIDVQAENWREMFQIAVRAGVVPPNVSSTAENLLEILANMSGSPDTLAAPLNFQNGRMSFGPIPLGPAPRFYQR